MAKTLHLVIPGLLNGWPQAQQSDFPRPNAAALERLLSRATVQETDVIGADATLFRLFEVPIAADRDLPVAAVTALADGAYAADGWWLRADPVHLRADLHQVLLFDARFLDISAAEARSLTMEFNQVFAGEGRALQAPSPGRWYLRLNDDPGLRTHPLLEAIGRNVNPLLPYGNESRRWHAWLTEVQMLFHGARVNIERESRGQLPINSVWLWGGGELPSQAHSPGDGIYADDPLVRGLARLAGRAVGPLPGHAKDWYKAAEAEEDTLVVLATTCYDRADDNPYRWVEHVNILERDWFGHCLAMLQSKELAALYLYPCDGRVYKITAGGLRRFWRPTRALIGHCRR